MERFGSGLKIMASESRQLIGKEFLKCLKKRRERKSMRAPGWDSRSSAKPWNGWAAGSASNPLLAEAANFGLSFPKRMSNKNGPILLVEDNDNDVIFMQRALKNAELLNPLHIANDGEQAIDYLTGKGEFSDRIKFPLPILIFLDLKL